MVNSLKCKQITNNAKVIYVYDEKFGGWINVTKFLENLKHTIKTVENKSRERKDFNLIRLYYASCWINLILWNCLFMAEKAGALLRFQLFYYDINYLSCNNIAHDNSPPSTTKTVFLYRNVEISDTLIIVFIS